MLPARERVNPSFHGIRSWRFSSKKFLAPRQAIVNDQFHQRIVPTGFAHHSPLQRRRDNIVAFLKNIGLDDQSLAGNAFDGVTAAVDSRLGFSMTALGNGQTHNRPSNEFRNEERVAQSDANRQRNSISGEQTRHRVLRWRPECCPRSARHCETLRVEIKRALVETGTARLLPSHSRAKNLREHFLLETPDNLVFVENILERGVAFQNLRPTLRRPTNSDVLRPPGKEDFASDLARSATVAPLIFSFSSQSSFQTNCEADSGPFVPGKNMLHN